MTLRYTFTQFFFFIFVFFGLSEAYSWCSCQYGHSGYIMNCDGNISGGFGSRGECEGEAYKRNNRSSNQNSRVNSCFCDPSHNGFTVKCGMQIMAKYVDKGSCESHARRLTPGTIRNISTCYCSDTYRGSSLNCDGQILSGGFNSKSQCEGHLAQLYNNLGR